MTPTEERTPAPPIDRRAQMHWGCGAALLLLGGVVAVGFVTPLLCTARIGSRITAASLHASGVFKATMLYAQDHDGRFPSAETTSNQAFRQLFPDYIEGEKDFFVPLSAWHDAAPNQRPDDDIGSPPDNAQCLQRGENHWAYVSGLDTKSPGDLPVIADGFVENQVGTYTDGPSEKGGVWKGTKAVVILIDGSAKHFPLSSKTQFRVLRPDPKTGKSVDIFTRQGGLPEGARVLNPE